MKKKVVLVGAKGKMGSAVAEILKNDYDVVEILRGDDWNCFDADLIVDFGSAESSVLAAEFAVQNKIPLIVGSTGQNEHQLEKIKQVASVAPLMMCSNFSVGIAVIKKCIGEILKVKPTEICVFEKHHKRKKDAPSGTAISLAKFISSKTNVPVQMLAERGGEEIGKHSIDFYFGSELIEISHMAFSRKVFAEGAKKAIEFMLLQTQPGQYFFDDII